MAASDIALFGGYFCLEETPRKKRSVWSKKWLRERAKFSHMPLLKELEENEPKDFINYLRMDKNTFDFLLCLVQDNIKKKETVIRDPVSAEERFVATLRFLATGRTYEDLKFTCAISPQLLRKIIPETCSAIYEALQNEYLKVNSFFSIK